MKQARKMFAFHVLDRMAQANTYGIVVISIVDQVKRDPGYQMQTADITAWERQHGRIPAGSVVFIRSDWSKERPNPN